MEEKNDTKIEFFPYSWFLDPEEEYNTVIRVYGLTRDNKNICVHVNEFTPFVYLELPNNIEWTAKKAQQYSDTISEKLDYNSQPVVCKLMFKKKLYRANLNENGEKILFPFLFIAFKSENAIKEAAKKVRWDQYIPGLSEQLDIHGHKIGKIKTVMHEDNVNPILQMLCLRKITWTDWITFTGKPVKNKETLCDYEFSVFWKKLSPLENCMLIPNPLVMSFDIEVNSSVKGSMPNAKLENDKIFQIGCIFTRQGSNEILENHLITLNGINKKYLNSPGISSVIVQCCDSEAELLKKFAELISVKNPNIIIGYNIFEFDIDYMIKRSILNNCYDDLVKQTFHKYKYGRKDEIAWSSSAYKNQKFLFINSEGRLYIDLLPLIKRDYKFANYRLKTVSTFFLGETKDPLTAKGIFKCYKIGLNHNGETAKIRNRARRAMSIVGKYCMIDTILPLKIFEKTKGWVGLVELSKVCNTSIFDLFTRGQQLKIFSQVYKICLNDNYVVEKNGYIAATNESYTGAHVFLPKAGVYDNVLPLDFSSLYPNIMIAYNICYSTWVPEDSDIPEEKCHVIEWHDHFNCPHDTVKRSGSKKDRKVICAFRRYKFLKEPLGILPTMLQNILNARDSVKAIIKKEKDDTLLIVLDKKQLALKISANSTYGSLGVRKGKLPFMPGAMCVTAIGREAIQKVAKIAVEDHEAELVYGDTDSTYLRFPKLSKPEELWDNANRVAKIISDHFPPAMNIVFEQVIYARFLILTKKRYMSLACGKDGKIFSDKSGTPQIQKKGVLLSRRDNSKFVRDIYSKIVIDIFHKEPREKIIDKLIELVLYIYREKGSVLLDVKDFVITKSVGEISEYKIRPLSDDPKKRKKRLKEMGIDDTLEPHELVEEYRIKSLPAQAQLFVKMKSSRGENIGAGTRLEYVLIDVENIKAKGFEKIEDIAYFTRYKNILKIDKLYYIKALIQPLDELLEIIGEKHFMKKLYKTIERKRLCIDNLKKYIRPRIIVEHD